MKKILYLLLLMPGVVFAQATAGSVDSAQIKTGMVNNRHINNGILSLTKLAQNGASTNDFLRWNGSAWATSPGITFKNGVRKSADTVLLGGVTTQNTSIGVNHYLHFLTAANRRVYITNDSANAYNEGFANACRLVLYNASSNDADGDHPALRVHNSMERTTNAAGVKPYGAYITVVGSGTATIGTITGMLATARYNGTGKSSIIYGMQTRAVIDNASVGSMTSVQGASAETSITDGTNTISRISGLATKTAYSASGSVTDFHGIHIEDMSNSGTVTNKYAIRIGSWSGYGATNNYTLYSNVSGARMYHRGNVWLNTDAGTDTLDVNGTVRIRTSKGTSATTVTGRDVNGAVTNVTVGSGLSLSGGTLSATGGGVTFANSGTGYLKTDFTTGSSTQFVIMPSSAPNYLSATRTGDTLKLAVTGPFYEEVGNNASYVTKRAKVNFVDNTGVGGIDFTVADDVGNLRTDVSATVSKLTSGTYTPTATTLGTTTWGTVTVRLARYIRVGDQVTVTGNLTATTSTSGSAELQLTLPVSSNFTLTTDASGASSRSASVTTAYSSPYVSANATNDKISILWEAPGSSETTDVQFSLIYEVK